MAAAPSPRIGESDAPKSAVRRWLSRGAAFIYGLVMLEVIIMISPFAFYFYAAYGPTLKWLNHSWIDGLADRVFAPALGLYHEPISRISALGLGALRFRSGARC